MPRPNDLTSFNVPADQLPEFFNKGSWKMETDFFCNECGEPSYKETGDQKRRGCKKCGYITHYPGKHFTAAVEKPAAA